MSQYPELFGKSTFLKDGIEHIFSWKFNIKGSDLYKELISQIKTNSNDNPIYSLFNNPIKGSVSLDDKGKTIVNIEYARSLYERIKSNINIEKVVLLYSASKREEAGKEFEINFSKIRKSIEYALIERGLEYIKEILKSKIFDKMIEKSVVNINNFMADVINNRGKDLYTVSHLIDLYLAEFIDKGDFSKSFKDKSKEIGQSLIAKAKEEDIENSFLNMVSPILLGAGVVLLWTPAGPMLLGTGAAATSIAGTAFTVAGGIGTAISFYQSLEVNARYKLHTGALYSYIGGERDQIEKYTEMQKEYAFGLALDVILGGFDIAGIAAEFKQIQKFVKKKFYNESYEKPKPVTLNDLGEFLRRARNLLTEDQMQILKDYPELIASQLKQMCRG